MDTSPMYKKDNQAGQFRNQRTLTVAEARETVGSQETKKGKRLNLSQGKGVPLQAKQADWLEDTDEEINKQELEKHYSYMAKIQEVPTADSRTNTEPMEKVDSNVILDSPDMCDNDIQTDQNAKECDDERVALANLIANLKLDTDENKRIQKQLKKANASLTQELKECKSTIEETNRTLGEFTPDREETLTLEQESRSKLNKDLVKPCDYTKQNSLYENFKPPSREFLDQLAYANEVRKKIELVDQAWEKHSHEIFRAPTAHDMNVLIKTCLMPLALKTQNDSFKFVSDLKQEMFEDLQYVQSLEKEIDELESDKADFSNIYDLLLQDELKKLIEKCKGKSMETKFDKPSVVRQPNALRIPKPSLLGKPTLFSDSLERKSFSKTKSVPKTNVSENLSKPVTTQILPQTPRQAVRNINVIKPGKYQIDTKTTKLEHLSYLILLGILILACLPLQE
ncbi:hypothetical protein Tco_0339288 [Tanacetum coccineum]